MIHVCARVCLYLNINITLNYKFHANAGIPIEKWNSIYVPNKILPVQNKIISMHE